MPASRGKRIVMWVLIVVAALITLPFAIGSLMPERYAGQQDVAAHPMTGKMMKAIQTLPPVEGRPAWNEDMGRGEIITVTTTAYEPPHHMTREMSSAMANMTSRWEYALERVRGAQRSSAS